MLDGHQRCATPLAADGKALRESQERQQDWGGQADLRVVQAGSARSQRPSGAGVHQHPFASDAVSEVAEHHAPGGRAMKPTPKVANDNSNPSAGEA